VSVEKRHKPIRYLISSLWILEPSIGCRERARQHTMFNVKILLFIMNYDLYIGTYKLIN